MDRTAIFAAAGYMACSSLMLIGNKLAVHFMHAPSFILWAQLATSASVVWLLGVVGIISVNPLSMKMIKAFGPVAAVFVGTIYANMKTLQYANVETFIVFRASTPIAISACDYLFLGRELPSRRSVASLLALLLGAAGYMSSDASFEVTGYFWVVVWYFIFVFNQVYIKYVVDNVKMTNWGRVYYSNFLAAIPLVPMGLFNNEVAEIEWTTKSEAALVFSCILGIAMSYFAFLARKEVSATYFSILGNVCKFITIIINFLIWDKHATAEGLGCLTMCLVAAYFYEQAPMRGALPK